LLIGGERRRDSGRPLFSGQPGEPRWASKITDVSE
jgi:hypothetical protein